MNVQKITIQILTLIAVLGIAQAVTAFNPTSAPVGDNAHAPVLRGNAAKQQKAGALVVGSTSEVHGVITGFINDTDALLDVNGDISANQMESYGDMTIISSPSVTGAYEGTGKITISGDTQLGIPAAYSTAKVDVKTGDVIIKNGADIGGTVASPGDVLTAISSTGEVAWQAPPAAVNEPNLVENMTYVSVNSNSVSGFSGLLSVYCPLSHPAAYSGGASCTDTFSNNQLVVSAPILDPSTPSNAPIGWEARCEEDDPVQVYVLCAE